MHPATENRMSRCRHSSPLIVRDHEGIRPVGDLHCSQAKGHRGQHDGGTVRLVKDGDRVVGVREAAR